MSKVEKVMREFKHGTLRSSSGQKVTDRKQAIAIALSEARKAGERVTPPKKRGFGRSLVVARLRRRLAGRSA